MTQPAHQALSVLQDKAKIVFIKHYQEKEETWEFVLQDLDIGKEYRVVVDKKTNQVVGQK